MGKAATIAITTRNRRAELQRAIESARTQTIPVEILVIDDGSIDGTSEFIRREYADVRLVHHAESKGLIVRRNEAARHASCDIIVSIDDDAWFSSQSIVSSIVEEFREPRVAAVAIPLINLHEDSQEVNQIAPDKTHLWLTSQFIGTAHAIRRHVFLSVGGYREFLYRQGEEEDLCVRLQDAGYVIALGSSEPILHLESNHRNAHLINYFGQRNLILFTWYNVPFPEIIPHGVATVVRGLAYGVANECLGARIRGTFEGFAAIAKQWHFRSSIRRSTYWNHRRLKKRGPRMARRVASTSP